MAAAARRTCADIQDLMLPYLCDALDEAELQELSAHLATGCPACAAALADAASTLGLLPLTLDPVDPPGAAKTRLIDRLQHHLREQHNLGVTTALGLPARTVFAARWRRRAPSSPYR